LKKKIVGIADRLLQKSVNLDGIKPEEMGVTVENNIPYFNDIIDQVVLPAEKEYLVSIKEGNAIDLKECIILLDKALSSGSQTLNYLKLRFLFIDEFQDTDDVQIEVFQKLQRAIKCRLFVVGDLKQSIYRFRGARLSAFAQLKESKLYDWDIYNLTLNYRTDCRLLDDLHLIFDYMGKQDYLPYTEKDRLTSKLIINPDENNLLKCVPCHGKDEEVFFDTLFKLIEDQRTTVINLMRNRKMSIEERIIAILVRSNWQVDQIVKEAGRRDVIIEVKSGGDLFQLPSTQDFYKLVVALQNCHNPVCLINFIESNYVDINMNYQGFYDLLEKDKLAHLTAALNMFFINRMGKSWEEIIESVYAYPVLFVLKQIFDKLEPWRQHSRVSKEQRYYMANYEYLLERMIRYTRIDTLTLSQIKNYLEINILTEQKQPAREREPLEDGIQILCTTVHKSKGLEYGTVILPYTYEDISDIRKVKIDANYSENKLSYTVLFDSKIRERNSNYNETFEVNEQISEESRILYVALTRAIRNCIWILNIDRDVKLSWGTLLEG